MGNLGGGLRAVDWNSHKLEKFEKNFYVEDKRVSARSDQEIEEFRRSKEMKVRPLPTCAMLQVLRLLFYLGAGA